MSRSNDLSLDTVIYGASDLGCSVYEMLQDVASTNLVGFLDDYLNFPKHNINAQVIGDHHYLSKRSQPINVIICIGDNTKRRFIFEKISQIDSVRFSGFIHPEAWIEKSARVSESAIVFPSAYVGAQCRIGSNTIVHPNSTISAYSSVGDFALIAPNASIGSGADISSGVLIGLGATVNPGVSIGESAKIGASAAVIKNVVAKRCVMGVPSA
ncbi:acetyltransferase [Ponticaulis profundi]|uniref:Acetyltransferase n=1 Tax=Ponticaulis profundi TaxID=2665222 RepID=A0ABW1SBL8_9PROT